MLQVKILLYTFQINIHALLNDERFWSSLQTPKINTRSYRWDRCCSEGVGGIEEVMKAFGNREHKKKQENNIKKVQEGK